MFSYQLFNALKQKSLLPRAISAKFKANWEAKNLSIFERSHIGPYSRHGDKITWFGVLPVWDGEPTGDSVSLVPVGATKFLRTIQSDARDYFENEDKVHLVKIAHEDLDPAYIISIFGAHGFHFPFSIEYSGSIPESNIQEVTPDDLDMCADCFRDYSDCECRSESDYGDYYYDDDDR